MTNDFLNTPIEYLKGVGPKRAELLTAELGISTFAHLLVYFPFRYVDRSEFHPVGKVNTDMPLVQVKGKLIALQQAGTGRGKRMVGYLQDETGIIELVWFQGLKWIQQKLKINKEYVAFGKPSEFNGKINMAHPEIEDVKSFQENAVKGIQPVYNVTEKLRKNFINPKVLAKITHHLVESARGKVPETLPSYVVEETGLINLEEAFINIHHPSSHDKLKHASRRLKFDELFHIQLRNVKLKKRRSVEYDGYLFPEIGRFFNEFYKQYLPFELTGAQKRVIKEIRSDLNAGKQMNRLLQGDVGSGKTMVALMTALIALDNGYQSAFMAPTEILAIQHYNTIRKFLKDMPVGIRLLTGSTKNSERKEMEEGLENGDIHILIGTHALLEERVQFKNLGFVVIDEQHRFGVAQRARMWKKNLLPPHILVMTATPIPRSLAMTLYGDMDYSVIDELPPGRKPVKTIHFTERNRMKLFGFMRQQIRMGQQVYVVYPLIEESRSLDLNNLMEGYESIVREFPLPDYQVSIVHGKMNPSDKDYEMQRFVDGKTQIMVSTTVIEVGVDVPNASVMVIENAERFGLSQLHQLRGRVGRGAEQSYCILVTKEKHSSEASRRIKTMVQTTDGFRIAKADLEIRGPGEMDGTRQSGIADLKIADLSTDGELIALARKIAEKILHEDPSLAKPQNQVLWPILNTQSSKKINWSDII
ncbi:MAG: ATP-dependent DNA helicase RecG [Bacteroidales bacterium]|nr:ATP-dependent DNA helicase RecG [Bacteroidales bacterium]MCF8332723.1 ATP-dependent DNA helicase RecG [Bacteroidales bacterium]